MNDIIEYKATTDRYEIEKWCEIALKKRLHSGIHGMFHKWFTNPRNFKGLAMVYDGDEPIGIAVWLSFDYDADENAQKVNTGCWVKPSHRRLGFGSELITQIKNMSDEQIRGFTGLYNQQQFWIDNGVDGRDLAGIYELARDLDTTPYDLGYFSVPRNNNDLQQQSTGLSSENDNE